MTTIEEDLVMVEDAVKENINALLENEKTLLDFDEEVDMKFIRCAIADLSGILAMIFQVGLGDCEAEKFNDKARQTPQDFNYAI